MATHFKKTVKKSPGAHWWHLAAGAALVALAIVLVVANIKMYRKKQEFLAQVSDLKQQMSGLQERNEKLRQGIDQSDNPNYIEKVAREELDLQKPGETTVSFVAPPTPTPAPAANEPQGVQGWFAALFKWFGGKK